MDVLNKGCCKTKTDPAKQIDAANGSMSFLSTLLLILIPKCPLCMTAYMSALVLYFDIEYATLVPILQNTKPVMGVLIILMILMRRKDKRTLVSLGISSMGLLLIILTTYFHMVLVPNWMVYTAFVFAIWYNGNFQYFIKFLKRESKTKLINHH